MLNRHYKEIILAFFILIIGLAVYLGWTSRYIWATCLLAGLIFITFLIHLTFNKEPANKPLPKLLILFLLFVAASTITSVYVYNSLIELVKFISLITIFWLAYQYINTPKKIKILSYALVTLGLAVSIYALTKFNNLEFLEVGLNSNFVWKNTYAGFLLLILPISLALYLKTKNKLTSLLFLISTIILSVNLYFTSSQAAWLAALAAGLFIVIGILFNKNYTRKITLLKLVLVILLIYIAIFSLLKVHFYLYPQINVDFQRATSFMAGSTQSRLIYWQYSLEMFKDYLWLGFGLGNFSTVYTHYFANPWAYVSTPHSSFFYPLTGTGFLATLFLFIFIFFISIKIIRKYWLEFIKPEMDADDYMLFIGLSGALGASFLHSLVDLDFEIFTLAIMWWVILGVVCNYILNKNKLSKNKLTKKIVAGLFILITLTATFLLMTTDNYYLKNHRLANNFNTAQDRIKILKQAVKIMPWQADYREALANAYWDAILEHTGDRKNNLDNVLANANKAANLDSLSAHRHWFLGKMYYYTQTKENQQWLNITDEFKLAIEYDFHDPTYYQYLAESYLLTNQKEKANEVIDTILTIYTEEEISKIVFGHEIYENLGLKEKLNRLVELKNSIK